MEARVAVGLSLALLFIVTLCLIWFYRKKKGKQENVNQTSGQILNPGSTPLQDDDPSAQSSEVTYANVTHTKKKLRQKDKAVARPTDVTYSQIEMKTRDSKDAEAKPSDVTYADIHLKPKKKPKKQQGNLDKDAEAQPSEVTYADIKLKPKKKPKKQKDNLDKGKSSAEDDTVYSELK